ncbi:methionine synthase [Phytoactinopolyspora halotolerans]|uniref:Methionine synthase n=1 Tax=Phytoactinopolyspora halotolerans TaxID=1981512 RepID=A0A6L9SCN7_9ACTN|nr:methionine synthase [Phytoactinopolyspora halotolerans]NEE02837.1 methionine synthase [Phytoactinopolyspora halotolerans]
MEYPWKPAVATGVGSLPYEDRDEAARVVIGELADFPHVPELPGRGAGSEMVGRSAAFLVDLHVDLQPSGWRLIERPGADERAARSALRADLDALEIAAYGYAGALKVQVAGPLTLAATLERTRGDRAIADYGARRDLAASLAEGVREHVADVAERIPGASVVVQLDEPSLPAVLAGRIPTISGFGRLRSVDGGEAESLLRDVIDAAGVPTVVHCCAPGVPSTLLRRAGAVAVALDVALADGDSLTDLAEAVDAGLGVWPGVVPSTVPNTPPTERELAQRVVGFWRRLDQDPAQVAERTVITPSCGLAGADAPWARRAYALAAATGRAFGEMVLG